MLKKGSLVFIISIELLSVLIVSCYLIASRSGLLLRQKFYVSPINKKYLLFPDNYNLKYYYESTSSATIPVYEDWLNTPVTYTLNDAGFNNVNNYSLNKPKNSYRIITLGDSFTFGDNVNTMDNWPNLLEDMLQTKPMCRNGLQFEVINLGMSGYDMQYALERFKQKGMNYQPNLVIWFLNGDRWNELMYEKLEYWKEKLTDAERLEAQREGDYYPEWTRAAIAVSGVYSPQQRIEQYRFFMRQFTELYNGNLLVMSLPNTDVGYRMLLKSLVSERGDNSWYLDQLPQLLPKITMLPDKHPNAEGHKQIADAVLTFIRKTFTFPCW